jgi:hypothetical protein
VAHSSLPFLPFFGLSGLVADADPPPRVIRRACDLIELNGESQASSLWRERVAPASPFVRQVRSASWD